jgi:hypothetical protein
MLAKRCSEEELLLTEEGKSGVEEGAFVVG